MAAPRDAAPKAGDQAGGVPTTAADALQTDADGWFTRASVRTIERLDQRVQQWAEDHQRTARARVGDRYEALLGVAHTIARTKDTLATLRTTLAHLATHTKAHSTRAAERTARLTAPASSSQAARPTAACVQLLRDAPTCASAALQRGALLHAAWGVCVGRAAHTYLARHASPAAESVEAHRALAKLAQTHALLTQHATRAVGGSVAGDVLAALVVLHVLGEKPPEAGLALFHAQRYAAMRALHTAPAHDALAAMQTVVDGYATTLSWTNALFGTQAPGALARTLAALGAPADVAPYAHATQWFALGAPLLRAAEVYVHLPAEVVACVPPAAAGPAASEVAQASAAWCARVCDEVDDLETLLHPVDDLDAVAACRATLSATIEAHRTHDAAHAQPLATLHARFATLLDARAVQLVEQTLEQTTAAFAQALDAGLRAPPYTALFPPMPPTSLEACRLAERHLARAARHVHTYGHAARAPLARACEAIAAHLGAQASEHTASLAWLLHVCAQLEARVVPLVADVPQLGVRLAEVRASLQARWVRAEVDAALAAGRAVPRFAAHPNTPGARDAFDTVPTPPLLAALTALSRGQLRLGAAAPDTLGPFVQAWAPATEGDAAFLAYLNAQDTEQAAAVDAPPNARADRAVDPAVAAAAARLRLTLAPWTLARRLPSHEARVPPRAARVARVPPRIPPL